MFISPVASASPPFAAQARRDDEAYPKNDTLRRSNDAWAANGGDPSGCVQTGRSRRHRSSEGLHLTRFVTLPSARPVWTQRRRYGRDEHALAAQKDPTKMRLQYIGCPVLGAEDEIRRGAGRAGKRVGVYLNNTDNSLTPRKVNPFIHFTRRVARRIFGNLAAN